LCEDSEVTSQWAVVVGAAVGGIMGLGGQYLAQHLVRRSTHRTERREAYTAFLMAANRGIRIGEEMNSDRHADDPIKRREQVDAAKLELDAFLLDMDRGLTLMQLDSPIRVLRAGQKLRAVIDEYVALAKLDLDASPLPWWSRSLVRRHLRS
jgi:hypothetical protein